MNVTQRLGFAGLYVALLAIVVATLMVIVFPPAPGPVQPDSYPACRGEDDPGPCVWDSWERGNGHAGPGVERYVLNR